VIPFFKKDDINVVEAGLEPKLSRIRNTGNYKPALSPPISINHLSNRYDEGERERGMGRFIDNDN
jgi:hypothetical protein